MTTTTELFPLGDVIWTANCKNAIQDALGSPLEVALAIRVCLRRHQRGDWGDLDAQDSKTNEVALKDGDRILSAYTIFGVNIWIITEWDRSVTTILLPVDY
jgi:hypothetical protein